VRNTDKIIKTTPPHSPLLKFSFTLDLPTPPQAVQGGWDLQSRHSSFPLLLLHAPLLQCESFRENLLQPGFSIGCRPFRKY